MNEKFLSIHEGKGKELYDHIRNYIAVPGTAKHLTIDIDIDGLIVVKCEYYATEKDAKS